MKIQNKKNWGVGGGVRVDVDRRSEAFVKISRPANVRLYSFSLF